MPSADPRNAFHAEPLWTHLLCCCAVMSSKPLFYFVFYFIRSQVLKALKVFPGHIKIWAFHLYPFRTPNSSVFSRSNDRLLWMKDRKVTTSPSVVRSCFDPPIPAPSSLSLFSTSFLPWRSLSASQHIPGQGGVFDPSLFNPPSLLSLAPSLRFLLAACSLSICHSHTETVSIT